MAWTSVYVGEAPERVNRWLAHSGVCSRREAESLIADGRVWIDGERVDDVGRKILPGQTLKVIDAPGEAETLLTILVNKPPGLVSAHPAPGQDGGANPAHNRCPATATAARRLRGRQRALQAGGAREQQRVAAQGVDGEGGPGGHVGLAVQDGRELLQQPVCERSKGWL